jgi:hypothetical protein
LFTDKVAFDGMKVSFDLIWEAQWNVIYQDYLLFCMCASWSVILREESNLRCVRSGCREEQLHTKEEVIGDGESSIMRRFIIFIHQHIVRVLEHGRVRWIGHTTHKEMRNKYKC